MARRATEANARTTLTQALAGWSLYMGARGIVCAQEACKCEREVICADVDITLAQLAFWVRDHVRRWAKK